MCAQLCPTLCDPIYYSPPNSSLHGVFLGRILEWVAISYSRGSSWPKDQTCVSCAYGRRQEDSLPLCHLFRSVQLLILAWIFATPWTASCQTSLSTNSRGLLKLTSIESVMPSNHLILCPPLLFLPVIFPSIRVFSNESLLHIKQPKYWHFSFNVSPSTEYSGLISLGLTGWISLQSKELSRVFSNVIVQKHQFFSAQLSL